MRFLGTRGGWRSTSFARRRWAVGAVAVTVSFMWAAAPAAAHRSHRRKRPDLVISAVTINGLGHNPYLVIDPNGHYPRFSISVTTRNIGHKEARASVTRIELQHAPLHTGIGTLNIDIPKLAPGRAITHTAQVEVPKIPLGDIRVVAYADRHHEVIESNEDNNTRTWGLIPVLARVWDVHYLQAEIRTLELSDDVDHTDPGFQFRFSRLDVPTGIFYYTAFGGARTSDLYDPTGCFGIGEATASHTPWSSQSFLSFNFDLTKYLAQIKTSAERQDIVHVTCTDHPSKDVAANWIDLLTSRGAPGPQSMFGWETELNGNGSNGFFYTFTYQWDFVAEVPK